MRETDPDFGNDHLLAEYIGAFSARDDLYVENGKGVVRAPLTPDVVRNAVRHHFPVSAYLGATDGRTHVGAIDFDTTDGWVQALDCQHFLDDHAVPSLVSGSRRGAHLWVTSWDWLTTGVMHRALRATVALALDAETAADPKVEVFPKAGSDLAVGALRLPGLPHQKDQQVYPIRFLDTAFNDPTIDDVLMNHVLTTPEALTRLAGRGPRTTSAYPKDLGGFYGYREKRDFGPEPSASEVLQGWGLHVRPGGTARCPKHDDKHGSLTVFRDDRRVYCGAPHCPLNNGGHGVGSVLLARMAAP